MRLAAVAGHVITARRPLDVDPTQGALLAVGGASSGLGLGPHLELLLPATELLAGGVLVPGGVAAEAPGELTCLALDPDVLCPEALEAAG